MIAFIDDHREAHAEGCDRVPAAARASGFHGIGHYPRRGFMHIDTREAAATWGTPFPRWPAEARVFAPEAAAQPVLQTGTGQAALRGLVVGGAGLVAAVGDSAAGLVEAAQHPLAAAVGYAIPWLATALSLAALLALVVSLIRKHQAGRLEPDEPA
jgi:hypothetical protein